MFSEEAKRLFDKRIVETGEERLIILPGPKTFLEHGGGVNLDTFSE